MVNEEQNQPLVFEWDAPSDISSSAEPDVPESEVVEETPEQEVEEAGEEEPETPDTPQEAEVREDKPQETPDVTKVIIDDLVSLGMVSEDEAKEVSVENFYPFIQSLVEKRADQLIDESLSEIPQREKMALEFLLNGGSIEELVDKVSVKKFEVDSERGAIEFLKFYHKQEGLTDEEIEDKIDYYESRDNAVQFAKKYHEKWHAQELGSREQTLKEPKMTAEQAKQKREQWKSTVTSSLREIDEFAGFKFDQNTKKNLIADIVINNIKTADGQYTSPFINNFFKVFNGSDPKKLMLIAQILREDFNPEVLVQKAETKGTNEVKTKLQRLAQERTPQGSTKKERPLWDNF